MGLDSAGMTDGQIIAMAWDVRRSDDRVVRSQEDDFKTMIKYFDLDGDNLLNYHDFLQLLLPCDDAYLRAAVT